MSLELEALQQRLQEAQKQFQQKSYEECEKTLLGAVPKGAAATQPAAGGGLILAGNSVDPKILHNLNLVQYLLHSGDARSTIEALGSSPFSPMSTTTHAEQQTTTLEYEGHEIAHYNRAVLLFHNGRVEDASHVLRDLLQLHDVLTPAVLGRCVALYQLCCSQGVVGVKGTPGKGRSQSRSDEELISTIMAKYMNEFKKDAQLTKMLSVAIADSSSLHEHFKLATTPCEKAAYFNDLGVHALADGKTNVAALYFAKANRMATTGNMDAMLRHQILYNVGVCSSLRGEFGPAIKSFLIAMQSMQASPMLWLRLAYASLSFLAQASSTDAVVQYEEQQQEIAAILAKGGMSPHFALLQLPTEFCSTGERSKTRHLFGSLALQCAASARSLVATPGRTLAASIEHMANSGRSSDVKLLQYSLLYHAAADIALSNFSSAVVTLTSLSSILRGGQNPDLQAAALLLRTEALCRVGKTKDALFVLSNASLGELFTHADRTDVQAQRCRVEALFVNLAVVQIGNGSWRNAQTLIASLIAKISNGSATTTAARAAHLLQVYLELAQGNKERALELFLKAPLSVPIVA